MAIAILRYGSTGVRHQYPTTSILAPSQLVASLLACSHLPDPRAQDAHDGPARANPQRVRHEQRGRQVPQDPAGHVYEGVLGRSPRDLVVPATSEASRKGGGVHGVRTVFVFRSLCSPRTLSPALVPLDQHVAGEVDQPGVEEDRVEEPVPLALHAAAKGLGFFGLAPAQHTAPPSHKQTQYNTTNQGTPTHLIL